MKKALTILFLATIIFSCNRKEFKTYTGNYDCQLSIHSFAPGEPNEYVITTGHLIEVTKKKKFVYVMSEEIHIDSLEPGLLYYRGNLDNYMSLRFSGDSIYYTVSESIDGTGTTHFYSGPKSED